MLNWFRSQPVCPVSPEQKEWIERRFQWLLHEFGDLTLRNVTQVLPTTEFFPDDYDATDEEIRAILHLIADHMQIDRDRLKLTYSEGPRPLVSGHDFVRAAGTYHESEEHLNIWLDANLVHDPLGVVATLAHELGHAVLLGDKRITDEEEDHEQLTDLVTVFMGFGIFTANSVFKESYWTDSYASGWEMGKFGYLSMEMHGYALALFAILRQEPKPPWAQYLRLNVRSVFHKSVRYLLKTDDCLLDLPW